MGSRKVNFAESLFENRRVKTPLYTIPSAHSVQCVTSHMTPDCLTPSPSDLKEHALSRRKLQCLPKGIEHKIKEGIVRSRDEVESREYNNTYVFTNDRDLISKAISEEIKARTASPNTTFQGTPAFIQ